MKLALYYGTLETSYVISRQLGYEHTELPQFSSQLLFHLTKDSEKGFLVSAEYNKHQIELGGECNGEKSCPLESFESFIQTIIADENQLGSCSPAEKNLLFNSEMNIPTNDTFTLQFIVAVSILGFLSIIIGGFLGHKAAQKENNKRRIRAVESDPEALLP